MLNLDIRVEFSIWDRSGRVPPEFVEWGMYMKCMFIQVLVLVISFLLLCSFLDPINSEDILYLILALVTISRFRGFKDSNTPNVILIVDEFRKLRTRFRREALDNGRKTRKDIWGRYSLARD